MTLLELRGLVYQALGESPETGPAFVSEATVTHFLNRTQDELAVLTERPRGEVALSLEYGVARYSVPEELLSLRSATWQGVPLEILTENQADRSMQAQGAPFHTGGLVSPFSGSVVWMEEGQPSASNSWRSQSTRQEPLALMLSGSSARELRLWPLPELEEPTALSASGGIPILWQAQADWMTVLDDHAPGIPEFFLDSSQGLFINSVKSEPASAAEVSQSLNLWQFGGVGGDDWVEVNFTGSHNQDGLPVGFIQSVVLSAVILLEGILKPQELVEATNTPSFPEHWHPALIHGALYWIYLQDGEIRNESKAAQHRSLFMQMVSGFISQDAGVRLGSHQGATLRIRNSWRS
jgi:hypothetical protein